MNIQTIDSANAVTIEIDPDKFQEIGWVDSNQIEFTFLPLEELLPFGDIAKILFRDEKIFIKPYNMGRIYIYSQEGVPHGIIDHAGAGPGEYLDLSDFDINNSKKQIIVSDAGNRKFVTYSYSGDFISEKPVNFSIKLLKSYPTDNGIQYIVDLRYSNILPGQNKVFNINLFDENWEFIKGYFPFSQFRGGMLGHPYMFFSKTDTCIGYYKTFTDSIFHFNNNEMSLAYYLKFPKPVYSYEEFEKSQGVEIGDRVYNIIYDESPSYLLLGYMYKNKIYKLLYDKVGQKVQYFTSYTKNEYCSQSIFSYILGLHGSKLVLQCNALNVDCVIDIFQKTLSNEQLAALNKIQEVDNNFLILVQL